MPRWSCGTADDRAATRQPRAGLVPFLLVGLLPGAAGALQVYTPAPSDAPSTQSYVYESWTVENGLPVNGVNKLHQDSNGYLWFATWDGLVRFDGVRFVVFNTGNTDGLPSNRIVDLEAGAPGTLWVRTEQSHLVRVRAGEFTHFGAAHGLRDGSTRSVHAEPDGGVWIGTAEGAFRLEGERFVPVAPDRIRGHVERLVRDASGVLWVGAPLEGLYRVAEDGSVVSYDRDEWLASAHISSLLPDREGRLWIGTAEGLYRWQAGRIRPVLLEDGSPLNGNVWALRNDPSGDVWVSTEQGLFASAGERLRDVGSVLGVDALPYFQPGTGVPWQAVPDRLYRAGLPVLQLRRAGADDRPATVVSDMMWDHEGSLWIGTRNDGLFRMKPAPFSIFSVPEGLGHPNAAVVLVDRDGATWIGTRGGGLSRLAAGGITTWTPEHGFPLLVTALMQDREGNLWLGTGASGIRVCRLPELVCGDPPGGQPAPNREVLALHQDRAGAVWAGTRPGLHRLADGTWQRMDPEEATQPPVVRAFLETDDGTLWMATNGAGVWAHRENRLSRLRAADGLPSDVIRSLHQDASGRLWVGTEGRGLARVHPEFDASGRLASPVIDTVRQRDGLFEEVIHRILEDDAGRLWMSGNRGIFRIDLAELEAFFEGRVPRVHSTVYTERDGLRNREANGGFHPAGTRGPDGRLWFPTQDGVVSVDPANSPRNSVPPPVMVERLATAERELHPSAEPLRLGAGERNLAIDYTALSFMAPENVRFRYRLEGFDDLWVEAGGRRTAYFTNLRPGRYRFRVTASNNDGVWNETGASLAFMVAPRLYERAGVRLFLVLNLVIAGLVVVRMRLRHLALRERELTALVEARTATLRRQEERLAAQNEKLAAQAEALAELHEARSRLFANLSHEFRTPLTLILGPIQGLLAGRYGSLHPSARDQHELMLRNGRRLLRLINQILDLARLQAGALQLDRRRGNLVSFARASTQAFAPLAERRGIELRFHAACSEVWVAFDREQFEKVLLNLLSNALKFTGPGGTVEVTVRDEGHSAEIVVADSGVGIPPEELSRVFERFHQADASAMRRHEGTGIGLALARELVELHGGEIHAESVLGAGARFVVRLPAGPAVEPDAEAVAAGDSSNSSAPEPGAAAAPRGRTRSPPDAEVRGIPDEDFDTGIGRRWPEDRSASSDHGIGEDRTTVLVVDDNPDVRTYVRSILEATYRVIEAGDGRAGLEAARAALPDLIVADVMMPELDGLALSRALKDDPMTDAVPVLLLTARAAPEDHVAGFETGADAYLVKPFDPAVLEARARALLAQRQRLRERFGRSGAAPPVAPPATPSPLEGRLRPLVEAHLTNPDFGPDALARAAGMSYHQLYRALRAELESTPSRFIRGVRADCAAELLRQRAGSITEVAFAVGFESLSYFGRAFRERYGTTPSEHLSSQKADALGG
ncbi:MAG: hybrid sensor histidine kinase/response regulator [Gemmatimonadales bacterium]|nr:MAG: hybrid sensor histidine kinase/response regulator [Gemmatimonadales bacterium]